MWKVKVELVAPDGVATLANEYSYEAPEYARSCAHDIFEILAESDHESNIESATSLGGMKE
jgi:hypothetical protein